MRGEHKTVRIRDKRIARNARCRLIRFRETTVDHDDLAIALHRVFAIFHLHGYMAANDMRRFRVKAKITEDTRKHVLVVEKRIEGVLHLLARCLIGNKIELESCHLALRKQGRPLAQPQIPQHIGAALAHFSILVEKRDAHPSLHFVIECAALKLLTENIDFFQTAISIQGNACMEQQVAVVDFIKATRFQEETHMALQLFAPRERRNQAIHDVLLARRELIWVARIDGREHLVGQFVFHAVAHHSAAFVIDLIEQLATLEAECRVLIDKRAFDLELNDGHRLLDFHVHQNLGF